MIITIISKYLARLTITRHKIINVYMSQKYNHSKLDKGLTGNTESYKGHSTFQYFDIE